MRRAYPLLALLALAAPAHAAADAAKTPPLGPEGDQPFSGQPPAGTQACLDLLRNVNSQLNQKTVRFLLSRSLDWGPVLRADVMGDDGVPTRFVCVTQFTPGRPAPAVFAVEPGIDPLSEGAWGKPTSVPSVQSQNDAK